MNDPETHPTDEQLAALMAAAEKDAPPPDQAFLNELRARSLAHQGRPAEMIAELQTLAKAIAARHADEAARLCAEHVRNAARTGLSELAQDDLAPLT